MEDTEIMALLCAREERGMEALMKKYGGLIRYVVAGALGDERDAEECVSDVCMSLWQRAASFDPEKGRLNAWLTVIARNAAFSRLKAARRRGCESELSDDTPDPATPETELLRAERSRRLAEAVKKLSGTDCAIFYRKYYYMQPVRQIAAELGLPERAVEGRLYRLRKRLQSELGGDMN